MVYGEVCIYIYTNSQSDYLYCTALLLDAAPTWLQHPTKVLHCPVNNIIGVVYVATCYKSHACWYSICDDLVSKYDKKGVLNSGTLFVVLSYAAQLWIVTRQIV